MKNKKWRIISVGLIVTATLLMIIYSSIDWIRWYIVIQDSGELSSYQMLGMSFQEWNNVQYRIRDIHGIICSIFSLYWGLSYVGKRFGLKEYWKGIAGFFSIQVLVIYALIILLDRQSITQGLDCMTQIPFRMLRWGIIVAFGIIGWIQRNRTAEASI